MMRFIQLLFLIASICLGQIGGGGSGGGGTKGIPQNRVVKGAGASPVTGSNCVVTGAGNADLTCPGSVATGDASTSGKLELKGKTSNNTVTVTVNDSTQAQSIVLPAAAPTAGAFMRSLDTGGTLDWFGVFGAGTRAATVDHSLVTLGDCAQFKSAGTGGTGQLVSTPCSGGGSVTGGTTNNFTYWTGATTLSATDRIYWNPTFNLPYWFTHTGYNETTYGGAFYGRRSGTPAFDQFSFDFRDAGTGGRIRFVPPSGNTTTATITSPFAGSASSDKWIMDGFYLNPLLSNYYQGSNLTTSQSAATIYTSIGNGTIDGNSGYIRTVCVYIEYVSGAGSVTGTINWTGQAAARSYTTPSVNSANPVYNECKPVRSKNDGSNYPIQHSTTVTGTISYQYGINIL